MTGLFKRVMGALVSSRKGDAASGERNYTKEAMAILDDAGFHAVSVPSMVSLGIMGFCGMKVARSGKEVLYPSVKSINLGKIFDEGARAYLVSVVSLGEKETLVVSIPEALSQGDVSTISQNIRAVPVKEFVEQIGNQPVEQFFAALPEPPSVHWASEGTQKQTCGCGSN